MEFLRLQQPCGTKKKWKKAVLPAVLALALFLGGCTAGKTSESIENVTAETAAYVLEQTSVPTVSSIGGEWAVMGIKKSGMEVPDDYYRNYYDTVRATVKAGKGVLDTAYYTEYARVILGLCAIGEDPCQVEGYDLTIPLDTYEKIADQGMNAAAFALIASGMADVTLQQEEAYIQLILTTFEEDMFHNDKAVDFVAMGLEALSFYQDRPQVKEAVEQGIQMLSDCQKEDGSYGNCESTSEVIMALTQLGIDVRKDERFQKNGKNLYDGLMVYQGKDGGFYHVTEYKENNAMATEKALLALDAILLQEKGQTFYE